MKTKYSDPKQTAVFDIECFRNYWAIGFECVETRRRKIFEMYNDSPLDREGIGRVVRNWRIIGFNSMKYDIIMLLLAMRGLSNEELKWKSDQIIQTNMSHWDSLREFSITIPDFVDHIDLCEVSPGSPQHPSLKHYMARLHSRKIQELPIDIHRELQDTDLPIIRPYHKNDFDGTIDMYVDLKPQIELRAIMSDRYKVDLRSKSDAQVAEAVIRAEAKARTGRWIKSPEPKAHTFQYEPPSYIRFETEEMQKVLVDLRNARFVVNYKGEVEPPKELEGRVVKIGNTEYKMGVGGLHSRDSQTTHFSDENVILVDTDVRSYYPGLMIQMNLIPDALGPVFQEIFREIVRDRFEAKDLMIYWEDQGNKEKQVHFKNIAETLKIVANGTFGKTGQPGSILYAPKAMIRVTVGGQLAILMLIERLTLAGFNVVSANTDGFVTVVPRHRKGEFSAIVFDWECDTSLQTEEALYKSLHLRDVNNYIAVPMKADKPPKGKGAYGKRGPGLPGAEGQKHNPSAEIAVIAATKHLIDRTPIEETIHKCDDIRKFVSIRRVNGGAATKDGEYIGKLVRWYYSTDADEALYYSTNGNLVPKTDGARPMMELLEHFPGDIDYAWYVREAYAILQDVGFAVIDPALIGRRGQMLARPCDQKTVHVVSLETGVALCGKGRDSIRDPWVEYRAVPEGHRLCKKCTQADWI